MAPHIARTGTINAPVEQVYRVVADVASYPEFVPGVIAVRKEGDEVEMTVNLGPIEISWISKAVFQPNESIAIELVKGPFRRMDVRWEFTPQDEGTGIVYTTDYELSRWMPGLRTIVAVAIAVNADATIEAFRQRVLPL